MFWKNASIKIRTSHLLLGINLQIKKGDVIGIIGSNGSGKTVLAKAIAGNLAVSGDVIDDSGFHEKTVCCLFILHCHFQMGAQFTANSAGTKSTLNFCQG